MRHIIIKKMSVAVSLAVISLAIIIIFLSSCSSRSGPLIEKYHYDNEGKLISRTAPDHGKTRYKYNDRGLLEEVRYPGGFVKYGYDENGNRTLMKDKTGVAQYYYDAFNRLVGVIRQQSLRRLIAYEYNPWGNISSVSIINIQDLEQNSGYREFLEELDRGFRKKEKNQRELEIKFKEMMQRIKQEVPAQKEKWQEYEVKYDYNILGNLKSIKTRWGTVNYFYDPGKGEIQRRLPNGITTRFSYSPLGLLRSLSHETPGRQIISRYDYEYNAAGKVVRVQENTAKSLKTYTYVWDRRGYLQELQLPRGNKIRYDYDAMGNRMIKQDLHSKLQYNYDRFGMLTRAGETGYKWNRNGNLETKKEGKFTTRFRYDGRDLPIIARIPGATIRYQWDGDGEMISKHSGRDITYYLSNPLAPAESTLAEFDKTNRMTASYLYGDVLLGQQDNNGRMRYFLEDGFNSIRQITDTNGKIIDQMDYSPFGDIIAQQGKLDINFRTMGERFLPEIKSYTIGGRLYNPESGRHFTPDPTIGFMKRFDSFNKYVHGGGVPGYFMEPQCIKTLKAKPMSFDYSRIPIEPRLSIQKTPRPDLDRYGLYTPFQRPFRTAWNILKIPLPQVIKIWPDIPQYGRAIRGEPSDIMLPISASYLIGGLITHGWQSLFSGGFSLCQAPLVHANLILRPVLYGYWNFVFDTFEETDRLLQNSYLYNHYPPDLYNVSISKDGTRITTKIKKQQIPDGAPFFRHYDPITNDGNDLKKPFKGPDWPDNHNGGGGGGPGGFGGPWGGGFNDPFKSFVNQLGGIELAAAGEFIGNPGNITGAVFDPENQCIVLVGEKNLSVPSLKPADLATAFMSVFGPEPQDPQFSLDPADPGNPRGKWLKAVYIPEEIIGGTSFGKTLFEADWLLKQYAFGVCIDEKGRISERKSTIPDYKSTADLSLETKNKKYDQESWARFWIVSDKMILKEYKNTIYFDVAKMRVKAKKQVPDPSSPTGLRDVDTTDDPIALQFADRFTGLYDQIAKEEPGFEQVRELAKAVALAKWIKKQGIPIDIDWVNTYANKRIENIAQITALSVEKQKQYQQPYSEPGGRQVGIKTIIETIHLFGGVDLTVTPDYSSDDGTARSLQEAVQSKLSQKETGPIFAINHAGKSLQAVVLPITPNGQRIWKNSPSVEIGGNIYQFNPKGEVTKRIDSTGRTAEYTYDSNHQLETVRVSETDGSKITGERNSKGSTWTSTDLKGNTIKYKYGTPGYLEAVEVDDQKWATYEFDPGRKEMITRYDDYIEKVTYNEVGNIKEYETLSRKEGPTSGTQAEKISFEYDQNGNLIKLEGKGVPSINISYPGEGNQPSTISIPQAEIRYSYWPGGRIKEISHSGGITAAYFYGTNNLERIEIHTQDKQAEYLFNENGLIQAKDLLDGKMTYDYESGNLRSVSQAQYGEARYAYDAQDRLIELHFPGGSWLEYKYESEKARGKREPGSSKQLFTIITHPVPGESNR